MVARWRHGAYRVVGLEFHTGTPRVSPHQLAPHLTRLEYLEFIGMPKSAGDDIARWKERLPNKLAVLNRAEK